MLFRGLKQWFVNGAALVRDGFRVSAYDADLVMDGTAQAVALATGVKEGAGRIRVTNRGAATEAIRLAFGTSAANAQTNLTISAGAATTGLYIPSIADAGQAGSALLGVPDAATHYAVANAVAADTQTVSIEQGI